MLSNLFFIVHFGEDQATVHKEWPVKRPEQKQTHRQWSRLYLLGEARHLQITHCATEKNSSLHCFVYLFFDCCFLALVTPQVFSSNMFAHPERHTDFDCSGGIKNRCNLMEYDWSTHVSCIWIVLESMSLLSFALAGSWEMAVGISIEKKTCRFAGSHKYHSRNVIRLLASIFQ